MEGMKSAFDRAWERAEKLGKLSSEEIKQKKEEELTLLGRGLAQRYLQRGHADLLAEEVSKYEGEEREIAVKATLSNLVAAIEIGNDEAAARAMAGISTLGGDGRVGEIAGEIEALYQEYKLERQQQYEKERDEIQRSLKEILHQLRISGSAVSELNVEASQAWETLSAALYSEFDEKLQQLKRELANLLGLG